MRGLWHKWFDAKAFVTQLAVAAVVALIAFISADVRLSFVKNANLLVIVNACAIALYWLVFRLVISRNNAVACANGPISLRVMRFEMINALELDDEQDFRRLENAVLQNWLVCAVWIQVESRGSARRAENWQLSVRDETGDLIESRLTEETWPAPKSWPRLEYCSLETVQHGFIEPNRVYNVRFNVAVPAGRGLMQLEIRCIDRDSRQAATAR